MQLKENIKRIEAEQFDAKSRVKESKVLQDTIRKSGLQMVNHDIECKSNVPFNVLISILSVIIQYLMD